MRMDQLMELANLKQGAGQYSREEIDAVLRRVGLDPLNFYQELEMSSRYVNTHRDVSQPSDQVQLHSHAFYEILYIRSGTGLPYLVGTERYLLQRGDVVIVCPGVGHRPLLTSSLPEPYRRDVLWLSQEFVDGIVKMFPESFPLQAAPALLRTAGTEWEAVLRERFRAGIREADRQTRGWEVMVLGNTVQLLMLLSRAIEDNRSEPQHVEQPELLEEVLAYMERHLAEKLTIPAVAQRFFVSERKISNTFREEMGVSFHRCLTQRRLIAAKNLIAEGVGLEQVGEQVGFLDYSSFYRAFRQVFGISPRQYRKLQDGGEEEALQL